MRIITVLLVLLTGVLTAQEKWSLDECITYALSHNIQIKQQELNTKVQENNLLQSKIDLAPSVNASANRNFSFGRYADPTTNVFIEQNSISDNYGLNSQVTLFNGFQKINTIKRNQLDLNAKIADLEKFKNDISLNIASSYLNVLFNIELLETALDQLEITKQQEDRTEKLVNAGSLAKGDLLEIKAQKSNEELQIVNSENQLAISKLNLKQMLELDTLKQFDIVRPNVNIQDVDLPLNVDEVFDYASNNLPQVMSAEYRLESYKKSLAIAKGARSPQLTLGGGFSTTYSDARGSRLGGSFTAFKYADQIKDNRSTYFALSLNIPIFNGWRVNTSINNSRIGVQNARYSLDWEKKILYKEIQQKYLDAIAAKKKYVATESTLTSTQEFFKYTQQKFDVGMVNTLDYNLAKNRVTKSKSDLLQAKYEYIFAVKILDFYQGKNISI